MNLLKNLCKTRPFYRSISTKSIDIFNPTNEHLVLRNMIKNFTVKEIEPQANKYNKLEEFNLPLFKKLGELGLLGITADSEYGGSEMDSVSAIIAHEEISYSDPAFCLSYLAHSMLFINNLNQNGSEYLKKKYLPSACRGDIITGMGMSEPNAGTDVLNMQSKAIKEGNNYVLNGTKMWITNGTIDGINTGDAFFIYARTGNKKNDISAFVIDNTMEGFKLGQKIIDKCGMRASMTAELVFDNVVVPQENLIGEENKASICMMRNLEIERVALAAMSLGIARRCLEIMTKYSTERKSFDKNLSEFGQIQSYISNSYAEYMAGKAYVYLLANNLELGSFGNGLDSDGVKLYCSTMGKNIADKAIQTLGGYGYVGEYNVERLWRDSKLLEIGGGTNEAHHKNMIRDLKKDYKTLII